MRGDNYEIWVFIVILNKEVGDVYVEQRVGNEEVWSQSEILLCYGFLYF